MYKLSRATVLKHYLKFRYRCFFSRADLTVYQNQKLNTLFQNVSRKSCFYQNLLNNIENKNVCAQNVLNTLPILSKKEYLKFFDQINTCQIKFEEALILAKNAEENRMFNAAYKDVSIGLSSGTSGERGLFFVNTDEKTVWTSLVLARVLRVSLFEQTRIALILRANNDQPAA